MRKLKGWSFRKDPTKDIMSHVDYGHLTVYFCTIDLGNMKSFYKWLGKAIVYLETKRNK